MINVCYEEIGHSLRFLEIIPAYGKKFNVKIA